MIVALGILFGFIAGWLFRGWWKFRSKMPPAAPAYFVEQTDPAGFKHVLYKGDDLQEAKAAYKNVQWPKPTIVEFYTHGNHTASRNV